MINFKINGIDYTANEGESILDCARRHNVYIPTMCYMPKTTANASCRMCSVEVEGQDGFILSCNTPVLEGINVISDSESLYTERQNIMKLYNVNHPLQCGVCDKSGECDLQNKTLDFGLDEQSFAVRDLKRKKKKWGVHTYDPALCIMCEKCTAVCNQVIGAEALYIKPGGYQSEIDINMTRCIECGECIDVCPVGAMASTEFKYTTNAWELEKVPSSCSHCSSACNLYYESKFDGISSYVNDTKIYRVTDDEHFGTLCGAGRFGFDYANKAQKDEKSFENAVEAFKKAKNVYFTSYITNEETYILTKLQEKLGFNLVNNEAKEMQDFMEAFASTAGEQFANATLDSVKKSDYIISLGSSLATDNPMVKFAISKAVTHKKAYVTNIHPIEDESIKNILNEYVKCEVGSEEAILAMLAETFVEDKSSQKTFFDDLDIGYLSGESNVNESELENMKRFCARKKRKTLILGSDVIGHKNAKNIAKIAGYIQKSGAFEVMIVPSVTNSLGVSLIAKLDEAQDGYSVGYNVETDFTLSAKGTADLDMPALNQQEGTFVNIDSCLSVLNVGSSYDGYVLNDIACAFGIETKNTVDYTSALPFNNISFDDLEDDFNEDGTTQRAFRLESKTNTQNANLDSVNDIAEYNGAVIYLKDSIDQFSEFTADCKQIKEKKVELVASTSFATAAKAKNGDIVRFEIGGVVFTRKLRVDKKMKGTIAQNPAFDQRSKLSGYRFAQINLEVIDG